MHSSSRTAARLAALALLAPPALLALAGCRDATAPGRRPPYIAIVARVDGDSSVGLAAALRYRVREFSGTIPVDRTISASARDTVIVPVPPATYEIALSGLPPACGVREGSERAVVVPPNANTAVVRFSISCETQLTITTATDGVSPDTQFVASVLRADGSVVAARIAGGNAVLPLNDVPAGEYTVALDLVDEHCVVTSAGGTRRPVTVPPAGGARAAFRIVCSDPAKRPQLLSVAATHHDGVLGLVFRARDPDRDIERYEWDLTDCAGRSLLPNGAQLRRGLGAGRTAGQDTVVVLAALRTGLADAAAREACISLRVADEWENSTPVVQRPLALERGRAPAGTLSSVYVGTQLARSTLQVADPDGDFLGIVVTARARDGVLVSPPDGAPDVALFNRVGYLGTAIPDLPFTSTFTWSDLYAIVVYALDANANFVVLEDANLFP